MREIPLTQGRVAHVDDADYEQVACHKWFFCEVRKGTGKGYAVRTVNDRCVYMHRVVADAPRGMQVDHIDGDRLNNARANLRLATLRDNRRNNHGYANNKSGFKGVGWHTKAGKWVARITVNNKPKHLGLFVDRIDAARAYNAAALIHFGEFACLNPIPEAS